ncbi:MAG: outer membrane lipoprotein-sorting protein [Deltaproteobacteria bacterium]|nr:outer membrane lipoprotein-sorting protein [Candidatus Zymogenaceae bacterium]
MKMKSLIAPAAAAAMVAFLIGLPAASFALTGTEIMTKVHDRENGTSSIVESTMILINDKGQTKERVVRAVRKEYGDLSKSMIRFMSPADVKGTGFLIWENSGRDDDQFLYLPALKQDPRRIASSEKGSRFMGTEFIYEDLENRKVDKDDHKLLREEKLDGKQVYVVESIPKKSSDSQYKKLVSWVRPDIWIPVKIEFYDKNGALLKVLTVKKVEQIQGIWTTMDSMMDNIQDKKKTRLILGKVQYNADIPDEYFTERFLKRD